MKAFQRYIFLCILLSRGFISYAQQRGKNVTSGTRVNYQALLTCDNRVMKKMRVRAHKDLRYKGDQLTQEDIEALKTPSASTITHVWPANPNWHECDDAYWCTVPSGVQVQVFQRENPWVPFRSGTTWPWHAAPLAVSPTLFAYLKAHFIKDK